MGPTIDVYSNHDYTSIVSGDSCLSFDGIHTGVSDLSYCVEGDRGIQKHACYHSIARPSCLHQTSNSTLGLNQDTMDSQAYQKLAATPMVSQTFYTPTINVK